MTSPRALESGINHLVAPEAPDRRDELVDLLVRVVVVHGRSDGRVEPPLAVVEPCRGRLHRDDVDAFGGQLPLHVLGRDAVERERDDRTQHRAAVADAYPVDGAELRAEAGRELLDARPGVLDAELERVIDRDTETNLSRVVRLPVLEATRVGADPVAAVALPFGCAEIE